MNIQADCFPCIKKLIESTLDQCSLVGKERQEIVHKSIALLTEAEANLPPACISGGLYQKILLETNQADLFQTYKKFSIQETQRLYPRLLELVERADDKIKTGIRISAFGNILDIANPNSFQLVEELDELLQHPIEGDGFSEFISRLSTSHRLLVLADNAGEMVFDKILIEILDIPVTYAVKNKPAFDDAIIEDAIRAGIDQVANLISTGSPYPGTYLPDCSPEFQKVFKDADLILAKGQANFETLDDSEREIFFLLKVKCEVVARAIGHPVGSLVLKHHL